MRGHFLGDKVADQRVKLNEKIMEMEINVIDARDLIQSEEDENHLQLIDVRSKDSFEKSSLPGFTNIPLGEISRNIQKLDGRKRTLILCEDGSQSLKALKLLESCGFSAQVIRGGLDDWSRIINPSINRSNSA